MSFQDLTNTLGFQSGLFFIIMRLRTQFSIMTMFKEKKNKTSTKADPAFVSSACSSSLIISKITMLLPIIVKQLK